MEATATLIKKRLIVNGQERELLVTGEEFLVDIIRNDLHLTGTKRGCRANQCGICTVLLDNKPIRSCVTKLNRVPDGASIITIEGIGTPDHLHPLQIAWMKYGAAPIYQASGRSRLFHYLHVLYGCLEFRRKPAPPLPFAGTDCRRQNDSVLCIPCNQYTWRTPVPWIIGMVWILSLLPVSVF